MSSKEDLLTDVVTFLKETLSSEALSVNANRQRLALLLRLSFYVDHTNGITTSFATNHQSPRSTLCHAHLNPNSLPNGKPIGNNDYDSAATSVECYEELETNSEWSGCSSNFSRNYTNTSLYSNSDNRPNNNNSNNSNNRLSYSSRSDESHNRISTGAALYENAGSNNCAAGRVIGCGTVQNCNVSNNEKGNGSQQKRSISPTCSKYYEDALTDVTLTMLRCTAVKCGQVYRKEKIIFVEHTKKYWAALLGTVLYIYTSEKDSKPSVFINVAEYKARPIKVGPNTNGKKDFGFEIVCPGKKTYQFYASSKIDMETWITYINHSLPVPQQMSHTAYGGRSNQSRYNCANIVDCDTTLLHHDNAPPAGVSVNHYSHCNGVSSSNKEQLIGNGENAPDRRLPSIPSATLYEHYDKPNPIVRPVFKTSVSSCSVTDGPATGGGKTIIPPEHETFYHSIEEPPEESRYDYPIKKECYYNCPDSVCSDNDGSCGVYYNTAMSSTTQQQNSNESMPPMRCHANKIHQQSEVDDSCEAIYDGVAEEEKENCNSVGVGRIQQIIQQIEEISQKSSATGQKKVSPLSNRQSKIINTNIVAPIRDEIYELVSTPPITIKGKV